MIVKTVQDHGKHVNFYEGNHIGFHPEGATCKDGVIIVIEGRNGKDCVTLEIGEKSDSQIYLMNNQGKTIEKILI